jgi:hypothetical protein
MFTKDLPKLMSVLLDLPLVEVPDDTSIIQEDGNGNGEAKSDLVITGLGSSYGMAGARIHVHTPTEGDPYHCNAWDIMIHLKIPTYEDGPVIEMLLDANAAKTLVSTLETSLESWDRKDRDLDMLASKFYKQIKFEDANE